MNDLRAIASWLRREAGLLAGALRAPALWGVLAAALALWALAYQAPAAHTLHIGGDPATRLRGFDAPFLSGFNASEPTRPGVEWHTLGERPYRWTTDEAEVQLPGVGGGAWLVSVAASSGPRESVQSHWQLGPAAALTVTVGAEPRVYHILATAEAGDVRLRMRAPPFPAPDDPRTLGLVIYRVSAAATGAPPYTPAPSALALLAAALIGAWCLARRLLSSSAALPLAAGLAVIGALLLATRRVDIVVFLPLLAALVWICYLIAALLAPLLAAAARALGVSAGPAERDMALAATVAAFGVRVAGMLHPYAIFSDTRLHVNNLTEVALGALFLTEGLPCEAGGGQSPYPPGGYLTLMPGGLLIGDGALARQWLVQGGVALLESLSAAMIWLLLRHSGLSRRAALLAAALYVAAPPLLRSYSVGEMANLFGQALLLPLLLFLVAGAQRAARWPVAALGAALLAAVLVSHAGMTISAVALLAAWLPLWLLGRPPGWLKGRLPLLAAWAGAAALVGLVYYSAFLGLFETRREQAAAQANLPAEQRCPPDRPLDDKLARWVVGQVTSPQPALAGPLLIAGAAGALLLAWRPAGGVGAPGRSAGLGGDTGQENGRERLRGAPRQLGVVLAACWLGTALSFGTLLNSDQAVRWQPFLFPALCIGAGIALEAWRRRGRAGRWAALAALIALIWYGLADWVRQVSDYLH